MYLTSIGQHSLPWPCNSVKDEIKFHLDCKLHFPCFLTNFISLQSLLPWWGMKRTKAERHNLHHVVLDKVGIILYYFTLSCWSRNGAGLNTVTNIEALVTKTSMAFAKLWLHLAQTSSRDGKCNKVFFFFAISCPVVSVDMPSLHFTSLHFSFIVPPRIWYNCLARHCTLVRAGDCIDLLFMSYDQCRSSLKHPHTPAQSWLHWLQLLCIFTHFLSIARARGWWWPSECSHV